MFSHIMVGANDIEASKRFYDAVLGALGIPAGTRDTTIHDSSPPLGLWDIRWGPDILVNRVTGYCFVRTVPVPSAF